MKLIVAAIFKVHHKVELEDQTEKITQTLRQSFRGMVNKLATDNKNDMDVTVYIVVPMVYHLRHVHICDAEMLLWLTLLTIPQIIFTVIRIQVFAFC